MKNVVIILNFIYNKLLRIKQIVVKKQLAECGNNVDFRATYWFDPNYKRIHLADDTNIYNGFRFISFKGHFFMGFHSGAAQGLTVITGNHHRSVGTFFKDNALARKYDVEKDVVVKEDVWIGANVTLLSGVTIGRGATIGAGSVCVKSIPPYAVVMGNPAKIVGFNYNPEEVIEHEKNLYSKDIRLSLDVLERNYKKYYLNQLIEIRNYFKM